MLGKKHKIQSVFDVGCGCGANMYLYYEDGIIVGGADFSNRQIEIAHKVFKNKPISELIACDARSIPVDIKYDAVISNSVFSYFSDDQYAIDVLDKMLAKSNYSMAIIDVHDIEKKDAFNAYRKKMIDDYEIKYKGLDKHFYSRDLFSDFADANNCSIVFEESDLDGYWNNDFVFNCYIYKNE